MKVLRIDRQLDVLKSDFHRRAGVDLQGEDAALGAIGVVERVPGGEHQPPAEPGGDVGPFEAVYTIQFDSSDLWGDQRSEGEPSFDLFIDLWESYLEAP